MPQDFPQSDFPEDVSPLQRALRQVSARMDQPGPVSAGRNGPGETGPGETGLSETDLQMIARFEHRSRRLGELLRTMPRHPVGPELLSGVKKAIRSADAERILHSSDSSHSRFSSQGAETPQRPGGQEFSALRTPGHRALLASEAYISSRAKTSGRLQGVISLVSVGLVMAVMVLLAVRPARPTQSTQLAVATRPPGPSDFSTGSRLYPMVEAGPAIAARNFSAFGPEGQSLGSTGINGSLPLLQQAGTTQGPQEVRLNGEGLRTLPIDRDWQILVVQVASEDRAAVMAMLADVANASDMNIETVPQSGDFHERSFGVLLTSAPARNQSFVDSVTQAPLVASSEWNPAAVGELDRQQLIAAVRQSMLNPTQSELHFGEVYLAVPRVERPPGQFARSSNGNGVSEAFSAVSPSGNPLPRVPSEMQRMKPTKGGVDIEQLSVEERLAAADGSPPVPDARAPSGTSGLPLLTGEPLTHSATGSVLKADAGALSAAGPPILVVFEFRADRNAAPRPM